jgi:hypothetical protein
VELRGFGAFRVKQQKARIGRNPLTGEEVAVDAKVVPASERVTRCAPGSIAGSATPERTRRRFRHPLHRPQGSGCQPAMDPGALPRHCGVGNARGGAPAAGNHDRQPAKGQASRLI